jgi:hypothetical protein
MEKYHAARMGNARRPGGSRREHPNHGVVMDDSKARDRGTSLSRAIAEHTGSLCASQERIYIRRRGVACHGFRPGADYACIRWDAAVEVGTGGSQVFEHSISAADNGQKTRMVCARSPRSSGGSRWVDLRIDPASDGRIDGRPHVTGVQCERQRTGGPRMGCLEVATGREERTGRAG